MIRTPTDNAATTEKIDTSTWLDIAAAAGSISIGLIAIGVALLAYRSQRLAFLTDVRQRWEELRGDWATTIILWDPDYWYYSDASKDERVRVANLQAEITATGRWSGEVDTLRSESAHVKRVTRFFAYVSDAVFRGHLSVADAYAVFGPEVVRLRSAIRWAAGGGREAPTAMPTQLDPQWALASNSIPDNAHYALTEDVVALVDLLSAEMARIGDTRAHYLLLRAEELGSGEGAALRHRITRCARRRRKALRGIRLGNLARHAEQVPIRALFMEPDPLLLSEERAFPAVGRPLVRGRACRARYRKLLSDFSVTDWPSASQ